MPDDEGKETKAESSDDEFATAGDRLRETSKWLIATFGALGATLIASLKLTGLGEAPPSSQRYAIAGFVLGLSGCVLAIVLVGRVLAGIKDTDTALLADGIRTLVEQKRPDLLGGYPSLKELEETYKLAQKSRIENYRAMLSLPPQDPKYDQADHAYQVARRDILLARPTMRRLASFADYYSLQGKFETALKGVVGGVIIAAFGVILFAANVVEKDDEATSPATAFAPTAAVLNLTESGKDSLGEALGRHCDLERVNVILLSDHESGSEVVSQPLNQCNIVQATVSLEQGNVTRPGRALPPEPDE